MIIQKFGGTSVGSPERMAQVLNLIYDQKQKIVVLSAVAGTTNKLVKISELLKEGEIIEAKQKIGLLKDEYKTFVENLLKTDRLREEGNLICANEIDHIEALLNSQMSHSLAERIILSKGELLSTQLFVLYSKEVGKPCTLINALDFMVTNENADPDLQIIENKLSSLLSTNSDHMCFITQGYICKNVDGEVDNLQRGGSDYTATIIGAALKAQEIQIWTDIDGLHNNDPRIVEGTSPVRQLSYREAAELAYFGAKILHPTCIIPAEQREVPVSLKNTFEPEAPGTIISEISSGRNITAIAAKDKITAIKIRSGRMLNAYGFLRKVFEVFESYKTPIDMITTSEVSVSLTIDNTTFIQEIVQNLEKYGDVTVEDDFSIICIVGDCLTTNASNPSMILRSLSNIPLRMVSYGGSVNNISILMKSEYKNQALNALHQEVFVKEEERSLEGVC
jgi:aspartate kinase